MKTFLSYFLLLFILFGAIYAFTFCILVPICMVVTEINYKQEVFALAMMTYPYIILFMLTSDELRNIPAKLNSFSKTRLCILAMLSVLYFITIIGFSAHVK